MKPDLGLKVGHFYGPRVVKELVCEWGHSRQIMHGWSYPTWSVVFPSRSSPIKHTKTIITIKRSRVCSSQRALTVARRLHSSANVYFFRTLIARSNLLKRHLSVRIEVFWQAFIFLEMSLLLALAILF